MARTPACQAEGESSILSRAATSPATKRCSVCKEQKLLSEFSSRPDRPSTVYRCKPCQRVYAAAHYQLNRAKYTAKRNAQRLRLRTLIRHHKDKPCADCGIKYPHYVMDFDHVDPATKLFDIGVAKSKMNESVVLAEIAKCDVVCANCHRERTYGAGRRRTSKPIG